MTGKKTSRSGRRQPRPKSPSADDPDVIVDFVFEKGLLYVSVRNIGPRPATQVSVRFHRKFRGLGGGVVMPELPMFRHIESLAPEREIRALLDTSGAYFARGEPTALTAWAAFEDLDGQAFRRKVQHDLSVYQRVAYVVRRADRPEVPPSS